MEVNTITIWDEQNGKLVEGTPANITQYTFDLMNEDGAIIGVFPLDNLPPDYPNKT